jgi:hypothetical protein
VACPGFSPCSNAVVDFLRVVCCPTRWIMPHSGCQTLKSGRKKQNSDGFFYSTNTTGYDEKIAKFSRLCQNATDFNPIYA